MKHVPSDCATVTLVMFIVRFPLVVATPDGSVYAIIVNIIMVTRRSVCIGKRVCSGSHFLRGRIYDLS